ncbi:MAG: tRNA pseudouridine(55) synthase TruB, partial [Pseudomonadota bacterium]
CGTSKPIPVIRTAKTTNTRTTRRCRIHPTECLQRFIGDIQQVPPKFSAVKIDGQRAYKLARDGEDVELAARDLYVDELLLTDRPDQDTVVLEMTCGKGGYVRSIARDLGAQLGCLGHVRTLRRVWSGPFDVENAVTLDQIEPFAKSQDIDQFLTPIEDGLRGVTHGTTTADGAAKLRNGNPAICFADAEYGDELWVSFDGKCVALGQFKGGMIHPSRVLVR